MARRSPTASGTLWPRFCMGLLVVSALGVFLSLAGLGRLGVDGSFALSTLSLLALIVSIGGLQWWALLDALRSPEPPEARLLHVGLIILLVPAGAILYYWLRGRSSPSPQSPPID